MLFSAILKDVVDGTEGALGAVIVGLDGMPVEEFAVNSEMDFQSMVVEFSSFLKVIEKGSLASQLGSTEEVTVTTDKATIILRRLNEEYFIILAIRPIGNFGKGRFLLRISVPRLLKEF
jgi:predicted regulator of Ras-like GTPase activity (Roadblock/LC7/MglB family)